jgi:hypothetical protein
MEDFKLFIIFTDIVFFVFGVLFWFFPGAIVTLSKWTSEILVSTDEKVQRIRKASGLFCFILAAFLTYIILNY